MISLHDISKAYDGRPVLSRVSLTVPSGGALRLAGPNGVGKSTLLKIVLGLVKPDSGTVEGAAGRPLSAVFQEDRLCPWLSAIGNLRLVLPSLSRAGAATALGGLGLPDDALARPVRQLSGGQRRRVALARALVVPSEIICLDEPFTGIDAASLKAVVGAVVAGVQGKDVLLVTHDDAQAAPFGAAVLTLG